MEYQGGDGEKKNLIWNLKRKGISLLSEFEKVWERCMLKELGNQTNFELELINAIYAADIGLSCQLHTILYMDWILSANQSFQYKSNLKLRISSSLSSSSSLSLYFITIIVIIIGVLSFLLECATVNDSLSDHNGSPFGTRDKVNKHCTHKMFGGWWYINNTDCAVSSNLNGAHHCKKRKRNMNETLGERKIHWGMLSGTDAGHTSPLTSEMKIKPVDLPFKC